MKSIMKNKLFTLIIMLFSFLLQHLSAQEKPETAARFDDGKLVLTVNLQWNEAQKTRFAMLYDLDSLMMSALWKGYLKRVADCTEWTPKVISIGVLEISKPLNTRQDQKKWKTDVFLIDDQILGNALTSETEAASFGVNLLSNPSAVKNDGKTSCFFLKNHGNATSVYLSGSFNQWSTLSLPMKKIDSGWFLRVPLAAGKHLYKYIVDGRWLPDPDNKNRESDGHHGNNSVLFVENKTFVLKGFVKAKKVVLSGSFNNWHENELKMLRTAEGWKLPVFLADGTHTYKFVVDGEWINDPDNPQRRDDGQGNTNSVLGFGESFLFKLEGYLTAKSVELAGSFNNWAPGEIKMNRTNWGWELPYILAKGNYEYKYLVDGQWITDPDNPFTRGTGEFANSLLAFGANVVFTYKSNIKAHEVLLTGNFLNWSPDGYTMQQRNSEWKLPLYLPPGRYSYKFIVDGNWILDSGNSLWEENEFGNGNSVLWIEK